MAKTTNTRYYDKRGIPLGTVHNGGRVYLTDETYPSAEEHKQVTIPEADAQLEYYNITKLGGYFNHWEKPDRQQRGDVRERFMQIIQAHLEHAEDCQSITPNGL